MSKATEEARIKDALNLELGIALGYTIRRDCRKYADTLVADTMYQLVKSDGSQASRWCHGDNSAWGYLPDWVGSVDKALELVEGRRYVIEVEPGGLPQNTVANGPTIRCAIREGVGMVGEGVANTIAIAICKAILSEAERARAYEA